MLWVRLVGIAIVGGGLGWLGETVHARAGVWLRPPAVGSAWIWAVYAAALFVAGLGLATLERRLAHPLRPLSRGGVVGEIAALLALYAAPPLLHEHELVLTALATVYLAGRLAIRRAAGDVLVVLTVIALDLAIEGLLLRASLYTYAHASLAGVPIWLAPLWGGLGLSLRRVFALALAGGGYSSFSERTIS